ncbi:hypothetical protein BKA70DRAFT_1558612 [Coprinopsis sp. MPI-PUGE-AT-0042]|nr:hypothetical protein BKA70DRAFT_1558612 [Coprinopsis sp. MPI-PUGE-AT-0042]
MPRRSTRQVAAVAPAQEPEPTAVPMLEGPDANLFNLRRNWKWAAFAQFFYIFYDLFAINDISVADIETDLVHGTDVFVPRIMQRLLFTLTYDRKISLENWQNAMRKQYDKRDPDANPLGPPLIVTTSHSRQSPAAPVVEEKPSDLMDVDEKPDTESHNGLASGPPSTRHQTEEPPLVEGNQGQDEDEKDVPQTVEWSELDMNQKLDAMHTLVEWQFQNPLRLRQIMKSDDDLASWRSEPVGYDKQQNAYWLIGGDRLWIQRATPKPANKKRKRKDPPVKKGKASAKQKPAKRRKTQAAADSVSKAPQPATPNGRSRAAKEQAKAKLDAQAKALAEFQRQQATQSSSARSTRATRGSKAAPPEPPKPSGTRTSSRLRHLQDDGWEQVPDEWLESDSQKPSTRSSKRAKTGLESDYDESASELTELSEDENGEDDEEQQEEDEEEEVKVKTPTPEPEPQGDFVEWETLCVTLAEWEAFPQRFAEATHYTERSFYKYLTTALVPEVTAELKAIEQKRRMEEALNTRKRSSRLAVRENEKEAVRLAAQKKAEEDAQNARARRLEARLQREQEERDRREKDREERRAAREARVAQRGVSMPQSDQDEEQSAPEEKPAEPPAPQTNGKAKSKATSGRSRAKASGKSTPSNEDWELDCEVCGRHGKNLDDGVPLMSCGSCSRWQHIPCHDKLDASQGRRKRDWNKIDFVCRHCLSRRYAQPVAPQAPPQYPQLHHPQQQQHQPATAVYSYPSQAWQQNGSYPPQHAQPSHADAYRSMGQTSSMRSSAYPAQQPAYSNGQSSAISFSHYQPQAGSFAADPSRGHPQQPYNPYARTTNGHRTADATKYQSYGAQPPAQSSWTHGGYAPPSSYPTSSQQAQPTPGQAASGSGPIPPPVYQYDTSYQRGNTYDHQQRSAAPQPPPAGPPPRNEYGSGHYAAHSQAQNPPPVQQQSHSHQRTAYPPQQ